MPTLADFIRGTKTKLQTGEWKNGHIPPSVFPLSGSRKKHFKYGQDYAWRLVRFEVLGYACRVLIVLNEGKQIMKAVFGVESGGDTTVLCSHESHGDHPGLHCHLQTADVAEVPAGEFRAGARRWPTSRVQAIREQSLTKAKALTLVAARYRFLVQGDLF
jgi:hypothetical protein